MVLRVNSSGGFLIMADVWYPHWKAAVDNTEVPVFLAQGAFRAIPVPEGSHLVELHYKPWFLPWSIAAWFLSVCSISSLAAWRLQKWLKLLRLMKCFPKFTEPMHIEHLALAYTPAPFRGLVAKHWNFLFYSLIGASGAALDYILFVGMVSWGGTDKYIANAISVTAGISNNFVLNAFFNFNSRDKLLRRFGYFYATGIAGLLLSNLLLHIGVDRLDWNVPAVKFFSIFFVVLLQFNLNKTFAFRRSST
jgi:putative flippase GtrA